MSAVGLDAAQSLPQERRPWQRALARLRRRRGALLGAAIVLFFVLLAIFAPLIAPYDPLATSWSAVRKPPSWLHLFGTDEIGRDV
ncbi:MAG TPA: ABC transporter permease, partial [Stellaceae bacterium]|nr:ABC transporter permease [Stellaceae bacterium]